MLTCKNFKPLTSLIEGTVITVYDTRGDLYEDNKDFSIIRIDSSNSVPVLYYVKSGDNYKICGVSSELTNYF